MNLPRLSEDERFELTARASAQEAGNRPRGLVILGGVLVLGSLLTAVLGWWSKASAEEHYRNRADEAFRVQRLVAEWRDLTQTETEGASSEKYQPIEGILSRMESLATRAGIKAVPQTPSQPNQPNIAGGEMKRYRYQNVRDDSLQALIDWMRLATTEIPGMELEEISELKSEGNGWRMTVIFRRWERRQ